MTDVAKIANAVSRPRIDPRKFVDLGIVSAVDVTAKGVHVDVTTTDGLEEIAAVSTPYGGPGYGLHLPVDLDRTVVLAVPDGVYNAGARVVGTVWDEGDPPPQDAIDNPDDVVLVVKPGQSVRVIVSGGGDVVLEASGGGVVRIASGDNVEIEAGGDVKATAGGKVVLGARVGLPVAPLTMADGGLFMGALASAITAQAGNPIGLAALVALQAALVAANWPVGASDVVVT